MFFLFLSLLLLFSISFISTLGIRGGITEIGLKAFVKSEQKQTAGIMTVLDTSSGLENIVVKLSCFRQDLFYMG